VGSILQRCGSGEHGKQLREISREGKLVEFDESKFRKIKYNKGHRAKASDCWRCRNRDHENVPGSSTRGLQNSDGSCKGMDSSRKQVVSDCWASTGHHRTKHAAT